MNLQKYLSLFKKILAKEISFQSPKHIKSEIIILDGVTCHELENVINGFDTQMLEVRVNRLKTLYLSLSLFLRILINIFKLKKNYSFLTIYFFTLLEYVKPKVVLTFIDNAGIFFNLAKLLEQKIYFIAIQNAARYDFRVNKIFYEKGISKINHNQKYYIPHYVTLGKHERNLCSEFNIKIKNFYNFGSLRLANFLERSEKKKIEFKKYKYDICLVSEPATNFNEKFGANSIEFGVAKLAKYTIKYSIKNKKKLIFITKRDKESPFFNDEMKFYKDYLDDEEFKYLMSNSVDKSDMTSYQSIIESEVVIATISTLLREKLGLGEKVLSTNLTNFEGFKFPVDGICKIENCEYQTFEDRLKKILNLELSEYFKLINKEKDYLMTYDKSVGTINKIQTLIKSFLQEKSK